MITHSVNWVSIGSGNDSSLRYLFQNCPQMNVTGPYLWYVNIGSVNDLVPSSNKSLITWANFDPDSKHIEGTTKRFQINFLEWNRRILHTFHSKTLFERIQLTITSDHLNRCWSRSHTSYGSASPRWVNNIYIYVISHIWNCNTMSIIYVLICWGIM